MNQVEQKFLATQINQPLIWLRLINDIFFIWAHGEKELEKFMSSFNSFLPILSSPMSLVRKIYHSWISNLHWFR